MQYRRQLSTFLETPLGKSVVVSVPLLFGLFQPSSEQSESDETKVMLLILLMMLLDK